MENNHKMWTHSLHPHRALADHDLSPHLPFYLEDVHCDGIPVEPTSTAFQSPLTIDKRMSLSPYQPTTGLDSFRLQKALAGEKWKLMTKEPEGCCTKPRPDSLKKFFPNPRESQPILDALGDKYGKVDRPTAKNPHGRRAKDHLKRGWKGMPKPPEGKEPPNYNNRYVKFSSCIPNWKT